MKKSLKVILCSALCMMLVFSVLACGSAIDVGVGGAGSAAIGEGASEPEWVVPPPPVYPERPSRPSQPDPDHPEDIGALTTYRMESESATHVDASGSEVKFTDIKNVRFSPLYGGCLVTSNLNAVGTKHRFSFVSDKALSGVKLVMNIAGAKDKNLKLADMIAVRANGKPVNVKGLTVNSADCTCLDPFTSAYSQHMYFKRVTAFVTLENGANTIELEHVGATGGNLDYIELVTSATITGFDNSKILDADTVWSVAKKPTKTTVGQLTAVKGSEKTAYTLPVLSEDNGYAFDADNNSYSFVLKGKKYAFTGEEIVYPDDAPPFGKYRMEAESAVHTDASGAQPTLTDDKNVRFSTLFSGNLATSNLSAVGTKHTFSFVSDKALKNVKLVINIAGRQDQNFMLDDMISVDVNGRLIDLSGITVNSSECTCLDPFTTNNSKYMYFKLVELSITLEQGDNTIVLEHVTTNGGNLDYIELETSAVITGFDNNRFWDDSTVWTVTKKPTATATGTITSKTGSTTKTYTLGKLSEANGYKFDEDANEFYFVLKGKRYAFPA